VIVTYYAGAADAAGVTTEQVDAATLGAALDALRARHDDRFAYVVSRCSLLLDGRVTTDLATPLTADMRLDVLPPFAGG